MTDGKLALSTGIADNFAVSPHVSFCKRKRDIDLLAEFAENDGADPEEGDGNEDVGGDARLQPRGSDHLQHGSSVSCAPWYIQKRRDGGGGEWQMVDGEATNLAFSTHRLPTSDPPQAFYVVPTVASCTSSFTAMIQKKRHFQDFRYR